MIIYGGNGIIKPIQKETDITANPRNDSKQFLPFLFLTLEYFKDQLRHCLLQEVPLDLSSNGYSPSLTTNSTFYFKSQMCRHCR